MLASVRIVSRVVDDVTVYWPVHLLGLAMVAVGWVAMELCGTSGIADGRWAPQLTFGVVVALFVTAGSLGRRLRRRIERLRVTTAAEG